MILVDFYCHISMPKRIFLEHSNPTMIIAEVKRLKKEYTFFSNSDISIASTIATNETSKEELKDLANGDYDFAYTKGNIVYMNMFNVILKYVLTFDGLTDTLKDLHNVDVPMLQSVLLQLLTKDQMEECADKLFRETIMYPKGILVFHLKSGKIIDVGYQLYVIFLELFTN